MDWLTLAFALLGHGFLWVAIVNRLHACPVRRNLLESITRACLVVFVLLPLVIAYFYFREQFTYFSLAGAFIKNYVVICFFLALFSLPLKLVQHYQRYSRPSVVGSESQQLDLATGLGESLYQTEFAKLMGRVPGNQTTSGFVEHRQLAIPGLQQELDGLKVVHISDIHMAGRLQRAYYEQLVDVVNNQQADVIAITGDIVEKTACWPWLETTLAPMRARLGRYFILGNHDLFIEESETVRRLQEFGWDYVGEQWKHTTWNDIAVSIGGNELHWKGPPAEPPPKAANEFRLALSHTPDQFRWCVDVQADLALAGHTHGGQFCLPVLGPILSPSLYGTRYCCGVFRREDTVLHVTRGFSGKTPLRLNCPPEVAVLTLTSAENQ